MKAKIALALSLQNVLGQNDSSQRVFEEALTSSQDIQSHLALLLGGIKKDRKSAVSLARVLLKSNDYRVKIYAMESLGKLGAPARPALLDLSLLMRDPRLSHQALRAIRNIRKAVALSEK